MNHDLADFHSTVIYNQSGICSLLEGKISKHQIHTLERQLKISILSLKTPFLNSQPDRKKSHPFSKKGRLRAPKKGK